MMSEIRALRQIVEQHLAGFAWVKPPARNPSRPKVLRQMLDSGFSPRLARELLEDLPRELDAQQAQAWVKGPPIALRTLGSDHGIIERGGVFALVGPTGVGKTTTTANWPPVACCATAHTSWRW